MNKYPVTVDVVIADKESSENLLNNWLLLVQKAHTELYLSHWSAAMNYYQSALSTAGSLLVISNRKSCALCCYMRTLAEYAYLTCKTQGLDKLALLENEAGVVLAGYAPASTLDKFFLSMLDVETENDQGMEPWVHHLLASETVNHFQHLH